MFISKKGDRAPHSALPSSTALVMYIEHLPLPPNTPVPAPAPRSTATLPADLTSALGMPSSQKIDLRAATEEEVGGWSDGSQGQGTAYAAPAVGMCWWNLK
jgi:hypothetical protein